MTLPVLPSPQSITPAQVDDYATQVERFADECNDVHEVADTRNKWAAITEYVKRTSNDGVKRAEAAMRHLEQRVGQIITEKRKAGEMSSQGKPATLQVSDLGLDHRESSEFVAMAEHPDVVERVIAESTDQSPPTRNKVRLAIKGEKALDAMKNATTDSRAEAITSMAAAGHTSDQIAKAIGHSVEWTKRLAHDIGVDIHADAVVGKRKRINGAEVIERIVSNLSGTEHTLDLVWDSIESLDMEKRLALIEDLRQPLSALNRLKKELAK